MKCARCGTTPITYKQHPASAWVLPSRRKYLCHTCALRMAVIPPIYDHRWNDLMTTIQRLPVPPGWPPTPWHIAPPPWRLRAFDAIRIAVYNARNPSQALDAIIQRLPEAWDISDPTRIIRVAWHIALDKTE